MKHGKRPRLAQKKQIIANGLNFKDWLVERDLPEVLVILNRHSKEIRKISKKESTLKER